MKVLLVGYGAMGREIERVLAERGHTVVCRVDPVDPQADRRVIEAEAAAGAEVAIEFSTPSVVLGNIERYAEIGLSAVVGTTGWLSRLADARELVQKGGIGLLYGANFSIGAHLLFALVAEATRRLNALPQYDISVVEMHHKRKKDSPSGTALTIADTILKSSTRKRAVITERLDRAIAPEELHVASVRGGEFPGTHTVYLDSAADTVELRHTARSRAGFALGAVLAAEWLGGRKGLYEVAQFVQALTGT